MARELAETDARGGDAGDDEGRGEAEEARRRRDGLRADLLGRVRSALADALQTCSDEFPAWLSWKVCDVLWAIALLYLGRRIRWVRRAQETLDL